MVRFFFFENCWGAIPNICLGSHSWIYKNSTKSGCLTWSRESPGLKGRWRFRLGWRFRWGSSSKKAAKILVLSPTASLGPRGGSLAYQLPGYLLLSVVDIQFWKHPAFQGGQIRVFVFFWVSGFASPRFNDATHKNVPRPDPIQPRTRWLRRRKPLGRKPHGPHLGVEPLRMIPPIIPWKRPTWKRQTSGGKI